MPFFHYSQNNSGGSFGLPAIHVVIEAPTADKADERAERYGLYFDGCSAGRDCSCCGDRWCRAYGAGDAEPLVYGDPAAKYEPGINWSQTIPTVKVFFANGTEAEYKSSETVAG